MESMELLLHHALMYLQCYLVQTMMRPSSLSTGDTCALICEESS